MDKDMQDYADLINGSLFDEAFMLLEKNTNRFTDTIERNKYLAKFFTFIFEDSFLNDVLENKKVLPLSYAMVDNLMNKDYLKDMSSKLGNFVRSDALSMCFAFLLKDNKFNHAKFLIPFIDSNLKEFTNTVKNIVDTDNVDALRFVCENMKNVHYNEGALLRLSSNMSPDALAMLIEEFDFDINEQNRENGFNLIHALLAEKNLKNFKFIDENYGDKINWSLTCTTNKNRNNQVSLFDLINTTTSPAEFYAIILEDMTLSSNNVEKIANTFFEEKMMEKYAQTDIYTRIFSHPNFDAQIVNLQQGYLMYGLVSKIGISSATSTVKEKGDTVAKNYVKILEQYLQSYTEEKVPDAMSYHIVGAAVHAASLSDIKVPQDAAALIIRRFPQYVNKPNPNGELPINQVEEDNPVFRLLINNGAIPPQPDLTWWGSMMSFGRKKKMIEQHVEEETVNTYKPAAPANSIAKIQQQMREDFKDMRKYITNDLCDPVIKFKCENMFLKADKLATMMNKYNVNQGFEEMHFLGENFSNYLKNTLQYYINVCQTVNDLASNDKKNEKFKEAKEKCLEQVNLLSEQLGLISDNIFSDVEGMANRGLRVNGRALNEKFSPSTRAIDLDNLSSGEKVGDKLNFSKKESVSDLVNVMDYKNQAPEQEIEIEFPKVQKFKR